MGERTAGMKKTSLKCGARRRKHAFYAMSFVAAATMLTIAANVGFALLDAAHGLCIDVSKEKYSVLTDETNSILTELNRDVYLYYTGKDNGDDMRVTQLLKSYAAASSHVIYRFVDTSSHLGFTQLYDPQQTGIEQGSVIVSDSDGYSGEMPTHYEVLQKEDLYLSSAPYYDERGRLVSDYEYFRAEQKISSAISCIMTEQNLRAVFLCGHEEAAPSEELLGDLSGLFYNTLISDLADRQLNSMSDTLIVISPKSDLSEDTYEKIKAFFRQGGKGIFFIDSVVSQTNDKAFARIDELLLEFGLLAQRNVIVGEDPAHTYMSRTNLVPSLSQDSPVTQPIIDSGLTTVLSYAGAITVSYVDDVETSVLLETDASSYAKPAEQALDTCSKQAGDMTGPFVIGVLAKKGNAQVALFGSASPVGTQAGYGIPGNRRLLLNTLSHINGRQKSDIIPMRTVCSAYDDAYKLNIPSDFEKFFYIGLTAAAIPLFVLVIGMSKWCRRRHM